MLCSMAKKKTTDVSQLEAIILVAALQRPIFCIWLAANLMTPDLFLFFFVFQTDTSDVEKVVTAVLRISSVFKDEAPVKTAVQETTGDWAFLHFKMQCKGRPLGARPLDFCDPGSKKPQTTQYQVVPCCCTE